ncbi:MAG: aromatic amino acid transport family protein [Candidatus Pacebacteria bacterium]|jgi:tyrosine-specific transport protein|nr:aromatic amino acid transport family protein [Candidatus Paceibacterota bacterium]MDD5535112.1 aromatic amino acid transport family protein [Candidatus Paceibacterota bacterium]
MMKKLAVFEAIAVLVGTIIGAGVFTLPYIAANSGMVITITWLVIVSFIIMFLHLSFGEIVLRTKEDYRLPGYIGHYLNSSAKRFVLLITFLTFAFSLLIFLLLGSQFLGVIIDFFFSGVTFPQGFLVILIWLFLSLIVLTNGKKLSKINFYLSFLLLFLLLVIVVFSSLHFEIENLNFFEFSNKWGWLIPYGAIFFALNGMVAIPEAAKVLEKRKEDKKKLKKVIIIGTILPVLCYLAFMVTVVGVSGSATTLETVQGLKGILGESIILLGAGLGFLAVVTSYLIFASYIKNSFINDFKWTPFISYFLVIVGPLLIYFLQLENLVKLISFTGGMLGGFEGIMILLVLKQAKKQSDLDPPYQVPLNTALVVILITAFIIGALCQTFLVY